MWIFNKGFKIATRTLDKLSEEQTQRETRESDTAAQKGVDMDIVSLGSSGKPAEEILEILKSK